MLLLSEYIFGMEGSLDIYNLIYICRQLKTKNNVL